MMTTPPVFVYQPEDTALSDALKQYLTDDSPNAHHDLLNLLAHTDPDIVREHAFGRGNALHQVAHIQFWTHAPQPRFELLLGLLMAHGARVDVMCEDKQQGEPMTHQNLFDCIEENRQGFSAAATWWARSFLPSLLNVGAQCQPVAARPDIVGAVAREHPAHRREQLTKIAQHASDTAQASEAVPMPTRQPKF